jgi:hypothetical protein
VTKGEHLAAVDEDLVDCQIETLAALLHLRAVERATPTRDADAAARRADTRRLLDAFLEQEALDARVRRRRERLLPPRSGTAVAAG